MNLNDRQLATTLAALRYYQQAGTVPASVHVIATDGDQLNPLTGEEIDQLCELLNVDAPPPTSELVAALRQIAEFGGHPHTPVRSNVKMRGIARRALAVWGNASP